MIPETAAPIKIESTRRWGATVVLVSPLGNERVDACNRIVQEQEAVFVPPFDSVAVMAAAGTIGIEILEQVPNVECLVVPVAGGGLIAGIAAAIAEANPQVRVIGAEPALADDAVRSFRAKRIVEITPERALRTSADGLRTTRLGNRPWAVIRRFVHDIVAVPEHRIKAAIRAAFLEARLIAEPSGAVAVAGALDYGCALKRTVAVLSGGNIAPEDFCRFLAD